MINSIKNIILTTGFPNSLHGLLTNFEDTKLLSLDVMKLHSSVNQIDDGLHNGPASFLHMYSARADKSNPKPLSCDKGLENTLFYFPKIQGDAPLSHFDVDDQIESATNVVKSKLLQAQRIITARTKLAICSAFPEDIFDQIVFQDYKIELQHWFRVINSVIDDLSRKFRMLSDWYKVFLLKGDPDIVLKGDDHLDNTKAWVTTYHSKRFVVDGPCIRSWISAVSKLRSFAGSLGSEMVKGPVRRVGVSFVQMETHRSRNTSDTVLLMRSVDNSAPQLLSYDRDLQDKFLQDTGPSRIGAFLHSNVVHHIASAINAVKSKLLKAKSVITARTKLALCTAFPDLVFDRIVFQEYQLELQHWFDILNATANMFFQYANQFSHLFREQYPHVEFNDDGYPLFEPCDRREHADMMAGILMQKLFTAGSKLRSFAETLRSEVLHGSVGSTGTSFLQMDMSCIRKRQKNMQWRRERYHRSDLLSFDPTLEEEVTRLAVGDGRCREVLFEYVNTGSQRVIKEMISKLRQTKRRIKRNIQLGFQGKRLPGEIFRMIVHRCYEAELQHWFGIVKRVAEVMEFKLQAMEQEFNRRILELLQVHDTIPDEFYTKKWFSLDFDSFNFTGKSHREAHPFRGHTLKLLRGALEKLLEFLRKIQDRIRNGPIKSKAGGL